MLLIPSVSFGSMLKWGDTLDSNVLQSKTVTVVKPNKPEHHNIQTVFPFDPNSRYIFPKGKGKDCSPVPLPAAAWLFGSGVIGMVGVARRK